MCLGRCRNKVRGARETLDIKPEKPGFDSRWVWALPKSARKASTETIRSRRPAKRSGFACPRAESGSKEKAARRRPTCLF
jgi:hypothetical protein